MKSIQNVLQASSAAPAAPLPAWQAGPFLRRTGWAAVLTLLLVALTVAVYISPAWAGWYLLAGAWALVFFALTPLIVRELMFEQRRGRGLALVAAKLAWTALMLGICLVGSGTRDGGRVFATALVAGITTPLAVVVLRALGGAVGNRPARSPTGSRPTTIGSRS